MGCSSSDRRHRLFHGHNQLEHYIHIRDTDLQTFRVHSSLCPSDLLNSLNSLSVTPELFAVIEYALTKYMRIHGTIYQHTVVILIDDIWAGRFIVDENLFPHTLVLELE
jgi:hypothetical protein